MTNYLSTYFLVSHGSRDPRPNLELNRLAELLSRQIPLSKFFRKQNNILKSPVISTGVLELGPKSLHEQIEDFWQYTRSLDITQMQIIPLFLLPGVHVTEDIPAEIEIFRERVRAIATSDIFLHEQQSNLKLENQLEIDTPVKINLYPYIGSHPKMANLLATKITSVSADAWVLISHGSRRPGGNEVVEKISQSLASSCQVMVSTAYWSVPPDLKSRVEILVKQGYREIGILPYFLFNGGITDAIADTVDQLSQIYPTIKFRLNTPLGATEELANLVSDLITSKEEDFSKA
ncbi:MAG: sirohydrochlorin chelatase [Okeania sp. SIO3I5]|uniref:sirohydrochlorin chelatase n=1 Tax=Okeania sp. SIO3I5 TaxID=2607805 RepID=UPI0013BA5BD7|nr:sirohydrochlorin chelatase [Okeania sp. SIO3I5]NEQ41583.1 sirohydrochlorin chelatase [Okeania sp. SIO3I5]